MPEKNSLSNSRLRFSLSLHGQNHYNLVMQFHGPGRPTWSNALGNVRLKVGASTFWTYLLKSYCSGCLTSYFCDYCWGMKLWTRIPSTYLANTFPSGLFITPFLRHFFITHGLFLPHAFSTLLFTTTSQHVLLKHGFEKSIGTATLTNTMFWHELVLPHHATRQTPPITPPEHIRHAQASATTQRHQHIIRARQGTTHQANRAAHATRPTHPANTNNHTTQHTSPPKHQPINRRHRALQPFATASHHRNIAHNNRTTEKQKKQRKAQTTNKSGHTA